MTRYQLHQRRLADTVPTGDERNLALARAARETADHSHIPVTPRQILDIKQDAVHIKQDAVHALLPPAYTSCTSGLRRTSAIVPLASNRPWCSTCTWSDRRSTTSMSCSMIIPVAPNSAISSDMASVICAVSLTERPAHGSSRSTRSGSLSMVSEKSSI